MLKYKQLLQTRNQTQELIRNHIAYLTEHYRDYLPELLETLQTGSKDEFEIAALVMRDIGYPANAEAVRYLLDDFLYGMSPSENVSMEAVLHMPSEFLIPYLIEVLWARQNELRWRQLADGVIYLLGDKMSDTLSACLCLPVLCALILQDRCPRMDSALKCFDRVLPKDRAYALPTLLYLLSQESDPGLRSKAWALIKDYPADLVQPYRLVLSHDQHPEV